MAGLCSLGSAPRAQVLHFQQAAPSHGFGSKANTWIGASATSTGQKAMLQNHQDGS